MRKAFNYYIAAWAVLLALFNVISFVSVGWAGTAKYTASFWIGYIFITVEFFCQLICGYFALKDDDIKKTFYNISLVTTSYTGLILSFVLGGLCMIISPLPYWLGIILCAIVLCLNILAVIKAAAAVDIVSGLDAKVKENTLFIRSLTVDAESLMCRAKSEEIKAECKKVYEAVRYSDPMSNSALASIESEITIKFSDFLGAVVSDDFDVVAKSAKELVILIGERNKKCKLLK